MCKGSVAESVTDGFLCNTTIRVVLDTASTVLRNSKQVQRRHLATKFGTDVHLLSLQ